MEIQLVARLKSDLYKHWKNRFSMKMPGRYRASGFGECINCHLYNYGNNNPVRYTDPDGRDIINGTDKYIIARLENPIEIRIDGDRIKIDTLIIPPHSVSYGAFDGARDEDGNYFKVSCHWPLTVDFEIDEGGNMIIRDGYPKCINDFADNEKIKKNRKLPEDEHLILSGKKTKLHPDYKKLQKAWDSTFERDLSFGTGIIGNSKMWGQEYEGMRQKKLREKMKVLSIEEIQKHGQMMHDYHVY